MQSLCRSLNSRLASPIRQVSVGYHKNVIDHYENPRNVGSLDKLDKSVGTGLVGAPACGDVMKLQIKALSKESSSHREQITQTLKHGHPFRINDNKNYVDDQGRIVDAKFKTFGCGSAIASSSLATEWVKGKTIHEAGSIKNSDIAKELKLPPVKLHCSMLAEDAIKAAIKDFQNKTESK